MSNFESVKKFMETFGQEVKEKAEFPNEKIAFLRYDLIREEGLYLGPSSGINIAGAIKLANYMGPDKTIVTVLCDYASRYADKIFNKNRLRKYTVSKYNFSTRGRPVNFSR